mgnify:CR=1 FL=1
MRCNMRLVVILIMEWGRELISLYLEMKLSERYPHFLII